MDTNKFKLDPYIYLGKAINDPQTTMSVEDLRDRFLYKPPVNPNVLKSKLYKNFFEKDQSDLGKLCNVNTLVNIPLQFNDPNEEILRSQQVLITPYNFIKY